MNTIVIIAVPVEATERDFETALREYFASMETGNTRKQAFPPETFSRDESPLWTWFLPNPWPWSPQMFDAESGRGFIMMNS